ncbi:MAG: helix-turn-helix domain-containing protein [Holophagales bacterium]|nr:MAG: helix-turn-helix domain-containing protein [Holophagales bacterium]
MTVSTENLRLVLGLKLRALRLKQGLPLKDVAEKAGMAVSYLSEIEKGKKYPKAEKLLDLSRALEVPFDDLVSLRVDEDLSPLKTFAGSNFLQEFPFELFGVKPEDLFDLVSEDPARAGALVRTFIEISQRYDLQVEHFLFAALRSYQQLHANYFPDLEDTAAAFRRREGLGASEPPSPERLRQLLQRRHGYRVDETSLSGHPELAGLRSVLARPSPPLLLVNPRLLPAQRAFILARELGYLELGLRERPRTSSWLKVESFNQVLNNFKASYFAGALLMDRERVVADLAEIFRAERWNPEFLLRGMQRYRATPEMLFYRLTELVPRFFGLKEIYFLRFGHHEGSDRFSLTKALNLSRVPVPHGVGPEETYCRRWLVLGLLGELAARRRSGDPIAAPIARAQKAAFLSDGVEFFVVAAARPLALAQRADSAVSVGFLINDAFRSTVRFADDPAVPRREVNLTCERCPLPDCAERAGPPALAERERQTARREAALAELLRSLPAS